MIVAIKTGFAISLTEVEKQERAFVTAGIDQSVKMLLHFIMSRDFFLAHVHFLFQLIFLSLEAVSNRPQISQL